MVLTSALELDLLEIISKNVALPRGQLSPRIFLIAAWSVFTFRNPYDCLCSLMSLRKLFLIPVYVLNTLGEICL
ncbi:BnaCnng27870D [Brassica napus]|uniref:BnaCnng27870D protein n=1 Tax=Brassica napus TaxID=3708 RepID=A0A078IZQ7_BRANA|nr:BnaCnng27870D [Brassica napus]